MDGTGEYAFRTLEFERLAPDEQLRRVRAFRTGMATRRSVRHFSAEPVARELVDEIVATAATAPSGANQQPWRFLVVSNPDIKRRIREAQLQKVPYMLVVGDREVEQGAVSVRTRAGGDQGAQGVDAFVAAVLDEIARKK